MADLTDEEIAELRRLALLEADEPSSAASDVLLAPNGQKIVARLIVDGRLLPVLDELKRRRERDARTLALLQRIEFASVQSGDLVCPECECIEATGHGSDCALAKLIADLSGVTSVTIVVTDVAENADGTITVTADDVRLSGRDAKPLDIVQSMLEAPETPEEKAALDKLPSDPEGVLANAKARACAHPPQPIRYDFLDGDIFFEGKDLNGRELLVRRGPGGILVVEAEEDECDQCGPDGCRVRNHLDIVPIPDAVAQEVGLAIVRASAHRATKTAAALADEKEGGYLVPPDVAKALDAWHKSGAPVLTTVVGLKGQPITERLMLWLRMYGTIYLHGNADGWIVSRFEEPTHPASETIALRLGPAKPRIEVTRLSGSLAEKPKPVPVAWIGEVIEEVVSADGIRLKVPLSPALILEPGDVIDVRGRLFMVKAWADDDGGKTITLTVEPVK